MKLKPVRNMSFGERGREIEKLRRTLQRLVKLKNNRKCHEELDKAARMVGIKRAARSTITPIQMFRKCKRFINGECRSGRLKGDLITIKV